MKKLLLKEILQYLPLSKVEEIMSTVLLNQRAENFLKELGNGRRQWETKRVIYITSTSYEKQFSNENWIYYLPLFRDLQPKALVINSMEISDISGIETMESLEEIFIGTDDAHNACHMRPEETKKILELSSKMPNLQKIKLGVFSSNSGSAAHHMEFVGECLAYIQCFCPDTVLDEKKNYYPFVFDMQKVLV